MTNYKQLSQEQRYVIGRLLNQGKNQSEIAQALGRHKSTIGRELRRNIPERGVGALIYSPERALIKTNNRHLKKNKQIHFTETMQHMIVNQLQVESSALS